MEAGDEDKDVGWQSLEAGGDGKAYDPLEAGGGGVGWDPLEAGPLAGKPSRVLAGPPTEVRRELVAMELMQGRWQQTTSAWPPTEERALDLALDSAGPLTEKQALDSAGPLTEEQEQASAGPPTEQQGLAPSGPPTEGHWPVLTGLPTEGHR